MLKVENTDTSLGFRICFSVLCKKNKIKKHNKKHVKTYAPSFHIDLGLFSLTRGRAEVHQEKLVSCAEFVGHRADHFPACCGHRNPNCCIGVIAAVHLQKNYRNSKALKQKNIPQIIVKCGYYTANHLEIS